MGYFEDPYSSPEKHGLTMVGEVEWADESYQFDLTAVWRADDGTLYWGDDSGCSCPSPFEDVGSVAELTTGTFHELAAHLNDRLTGEYVCASAAGDVTELLGRLC